VRPIASFIAAAYARYPRLHLITLLSVVSVAIELAAMAIMLPLSLVVTGQPVDAGGLAARALGWAGIPAEPTAMLTAFAVLFLLRVGTQLVSELQGIRLGKLLQADLSSVAHRTILVHRTLAEIEAKSIGHFVTLAGDQCAKAGALMTMIARCVGAALLAILYLLAITLYSPLIGVALVLFLVTSAGLSFGLVRHSARLGAQQVDQAKAAHSIFFDSLHGVRSVKTFSAENYVADRYRDTIFAYVRTLYRIDAINLLLRLLPVVVLLLLLLAALAAGVIDARQATDAAFAFTVVIYLMRFLPVVGTCAQVLLKIAAESVTARDASGIIRDAAGPGVMAAGGQAIGRIERVEFAAVTFSHRSDRPLIERFSATLERGRSYALVGASGSGKSTLCDLLLGFQRPGAGVIRINGLTQDGLDADELRRRVLLLSQDTFILNDTVRDNVAFGAAIGEARLREACAQAGIAEVIESLPGGYDHRLAYRGSNLSGGQRQRIGIARALARDADVLILDESTSALDRDSRARVVTSVLASAARRITLFITHDPALLESVDQVIRLPDPRPAAEAVPEDEAS